MPGLAVFLSVTETFSHENLGAARAQGWRRRHELWKQHFAANPLRSTLHGLTV